MDKTLYNRQKSIWNGKYLLLVLLGLANIVRGQADHSEIRVLFVGDILLSRNVKEELQSRKTFPWEHLMPLFQSADLIAGNLEGAVGDRQDKFPSVVESPVFNIDRPDILMLKRAGFGIITTANNHHLDLGEKGRRQTIEALKESGIATASLENSPQFITVKGVVLSIVSLNMVICRDSSKNSIPSVEVMQKLRLARTLSDLVIVSIHWGSELLEWPSREQRETARWLIKNGADLIIGSHPHVVQKPELIDGKPVFFSLGNHLFDQKYPATKEGLIADIRIMDGKFRCAGIVTHTKQNSFYPEIRGIAADQFAPIPYHMVPLKINKYSLKPLSVTEYDGSRIVLQAFKDNKMVWQTHPMSIISVSPAKLDGEHDFLFALEKHYSTLDSEMNVRPYVYDLDNRGLVARWRGSALAWPLLDAQIPAADNTVLCALHRGDSFILPDTTNRNRRVAAYRWNGFGFKGISDSIACKLCNLLYKE